MELAKKMAPELLGAQGELLLCAHNPVLSFTEIHLLDFLSTGWALPWH
jgi:hypothetical protein